MVVVGGRSSVVEFQPSKLAVVGSNPIARSIQNRACFTRSAYNGARRDGTERIQAHVAQLVEHVLGKDEVTRSIRVVGSIPCLTDRKPM
jgi:hypothetical protein